MEQWTTKLNDVLSFVKGVETWQWIVAGVLFALLFRKPVKRFVKRQVRSLARKVMRLAFRIARLYFFGI